MAQMQVTKGKTRKLPVDRGQVFTAGLGWDPAEGQEEVDLDLWVLRKWRNNLVEAAYWGNESWWRPDLGRTKKGLPWIVSPEGDIVHKGDDRTGAESATGYDEVAKLDLAKAPRDVIQYAIFATNYSETSPLEMLGMATNIICGVKEDNTGIEFVVKVEEDHSAEVSLLLCVVDRVVDDTKWAMTGKDEGFTDDMVTVAIKAGVKF